MQLVRGSLDGAEGWAGVDMAMGGAVGLLAALQKRDKIKDAQRHMAVAQAALSRFQREAKDIQVQIDANIELDGFESFADVLFDGIISDWMIHSKVSRSLTQTEQAVQRVEDCVRELQRFRGTVKAKIDDLQARGRAFVEGLA